jgi:3-hydroxyacyl-CoA dehydrogenase
MNQVATWAIEHGIGILSVDSPPVNALSTKVRQGLRAGLLELGADHLVKAIILICGGRTFFAGADISEFGKPVIPPSLHELFEIIENSIKLVIAAIHGAALGGGLELALVCHYRIAVSSAKLGLPEVNLGLLPGAGGTQRLPRLIGPEKALEMMIGGKPIAAPQALQWGVVDAIAAEGHLLRDAKGFANRILTERLPLRRIRDRDDQVADTRGKSGVFTEVRSRNARMFRGFRAPESIVQAVEAAVNLPFEKGLEREQELFIELLGSTESAAQRYAFFAEREAAKVADVPADTPTLPISAVAVIGAGTMGGGIAMNFLNTGIPVTLLESNREALDRGLSVIRKNYEASARKGRMTPQVVDQRMSLIDARLDYSALARADLIIEAVFESLELKQKVFAEIDRIAKPEAILASNTSFLDLDQIAAATHRPERVIGLHFFSPANVMRLLEVVPGNATTKPVIATAMKLAKTIGKVPVLSRVCHGFIANRLMNARMMMSDTLVLRGPTPQQIDGAMVNYGFSMGPFQMMDLVGLDVIGRDSTIRTVAGDLVARGRLGQKRDGGYYDYDGQRKSIRSTVAAQVIEKFIVDHKIQPIGELASDELVAYLLYPVVNEGARILEEGIAMRASDVDIAALTGYGWPVYRGGPMFWADTVGLPKIIAKLDELVSRFGEGYRAAPLLRKLAAENRKLHEVRVSG